MFKTPNKYLLLFLVLAFAFAYRILLLHWATYPPGADIGLHESVVHSITSSGNTDFLWNNYQMGGGLSLTFPGYHIFVSHIILMTGIPDYLVHSLVAAFFSSFIVLCAFLIGRRVWGESTGFIVAFLVAISRFDVEMLLWGGFPNAVTLLLIPMVFYLYLERERFSMVPFLVTTTFLSGAIFLTHSLSAVMFVCITFSTVIIAAIFSKRVGVSKKHILAWLLPIFLGAIIVSPFLVDAVPAYLGANSDTFTGGVSGIRLALLSTRVLPLEWVIPLFASVIFFFLFSKKYLSKFITVQALLLTLWILVPMLFTQAYLVGIYTDYNRFLYFIILPLILLISLGIDHGAGFFSRIIDTYLSLTKKAQTKKSTSKISRLVSHLSCKRIYAGFALSFLIVSFLAVPIFLTPFRGVEIQRFYQTMNDSGYEAMQWARQNTPDGSVFVSDAYYGWWFSGFAQRPTLSAVDPQYLSLAREFEPANVAKSLLDTNYMIDNGLIQVREDGGYLGRHNPEILAKLNWTYFPYAFLNFNNSRTEIKYRVDDSLQFLYLDQLPVKEMRIENDTSHATIVVTKGNGFFNYTELTTVYRGSPFVNMTITIESAVDGVSLDWLGFTMNSKGYMQAQQNNTIALLDEGVKAFSQLIFNKEQPKVVLVNHDNPCIFTLDYNLQGKAEVEIQMAVTTYSVSDDQEIYQSQERKDQYFSNIITTNLNSYQKQIPDSPALYVFDYQKAVNDWNISYIACRDSEILPKFVNDPTFSLVFINNEVAIFMVKKGFA
ncbi:hypothetical protein JW988_07740 [Candidatus Bathyarchaeota archaeon]|nr:hypothetical protein [Candidatus Bathyarchaeota archaeon]